MQLVAFWILIPLLFGAIFAGLGLLVRALAKGLAAELILPAGIAASIVLATLLTFLPATTALAAPVLIVGALAGFAVTLRRDRALMRPALRRHGALIAASAAGFLIFGASVFLSGAPTFTGYTQIVDIAHQFDIATWVAQHGRDLPTGVLSSSESVVNKTLGGGYPSGSQSVLGTVGRLFDFEIAWAYQPFLALVAASLVPALASLLRPVVASPTFRAVGALTAAQASILIGYAQIGGIKELSSAVVLALAAGTATRLRDAPQERPLLATVLPVSLAAAAAFSVFSLTMLPWLGLIAIAALAYAFRAQPLGVLAVRGVTAIVLFAVLAVPTVIGATDTGGAVSVVQNDADIGNLAAPVTHLAASGILFTADHRFPVTGTAKTASTAIGVVAIVLAILGLGVAWRRGARELVILAAAGVGGLAVVIYIFSPWIELKAMAIMAPITLVLAVAGLGALLDRRPLKLLAWGGLAALLAVLLVADVQRYRGAVLAPYDRLGELETLGHRYAGQGPTLLPDFEEQGEYLMRQADAVSPVNAWEFGFPIRPEVAKLKPGVQLAWDLDEIDPEYLQRFKLIVARRTPGSSRAPGNFALAEQGRYYTVWRRTAEPAPAAHAPLSSSAERADQRVCRTFLRTQRRASAITVAPAPLVYSATFDQANVSANLPLIGPGQMNVRGPGRAKGTIEVGATGRYELYFATNAFRETELRIDGRKVADYSDNTYALRADLITTLELTRGKHEVELVRGGGSFAPGTTDPPEHVLGPVYLVPAGQLFPALRTTPPREAACAPQIDWLEARD